MALSINSTAFRLPDNQYIKEVTQKDLLVLHFTAGSTAKSAIDFWKSTADRVATAYVLDTDGTVYQVFDPRCYAFHLGLKGTRAHDKRSVGIEIANVGPLKKVGDTLMWWPGNFKQRYCRLDETEKFVKSKFRGYEYWATYTPAQAEAIGPLVNHICSELGIPRELPPLDKREIFDTSFFGNWKGIASHQNFRSDKTDVGPAFNWNEWIR